MIFFCLKCGHVLDDDEEDFKCIGQVFSSDEPYPGDSVCAYCGDDNYIDLDEMPDMLAEYFKEIQSLKAEIKKLKGGRKMAKYISADALKRHIKEHANPYGKPIYDYDTAIKIMALIDNTPAADVMPVVRCDDCAHCGFCRNSTNLEVM